MKNFSYIEAMTLQISLLDDETIAKILSVMTQEEKIELSQQLILLAQNYKIDTKDFNSLEFTDIDFKVKEIIRLFFRKGE